MSDEPTPTPTEGETVPVPDKGGWIDGETGEYAFGGPPPVEPPPEIPVTREGATPQPGVVQPIRKSEPAQQPPKKAS